MTKGKEKDKVTVSMSDGSDLETITYEEALSELEKIVSALEANQTSLEESLALFERGRLLVQHCSALLQSAELQLNTLLPGLEEDIETEEEEL